MSSGMTNFHDESCCHPDCPVRHLDSQTGFFSSVRHMSYKRTQNGFIDDIPNAEELRWWVAEEGGASRYFKGVASQDELLLYLENLLQPPKSTEIDMTKTYYIGTEPEDWEAVIADLVPGGNLMIWCDRLEYPRVCCRAEDQGLEIRDCLTVLCHDKTLMVLWAMKSTDGTFAENAIQHGVAGLNIDAGRIGISQNDPNRRPNRVLTEFPDAEKRVALGVGMKDNTVQDEGAHSSKGRFPSNFLLMHHPDCECVGTKRVKPSNGSGKAHHDNHKVGNTLYSGEWNPKGISGLAGFVSEDGTEEVDDWSCHDSCVIQALDEMTGRLTSGSGAIKKSSSSTYLGNRGSAYGQESRPLGTKMISYADTGGASRFFKQVRDHADLLAYLEALLEPPTTGL